MAQCHLGSGCQSIPCTYTLVRSIDTHSHVDTPLIRDSFFFLKTHPAWHSLHLCPEDMLETTARADPAASEPFTAITRAVLGEYENPICLRIQVTLLFSLAYPQSTSFWMFLRFRTGTLNSSTVCNTHLREVDGGCRVRAMCLFGTKSQCAI